MAEYNLKSKKSFLTICKALKKDDIKLIAIQSYNRFYKIGEFSVTFGEKCCYEYVLATILKHYNKDVLNKIDEKIMLVFLEMYNPTMFKESLKPIIKESKIDYKEEWLVAIDYFSKYHSWIEDEIYGRELEDSLKNNLGPFALIDLELNKVDSGYQCPFCKEHMNSINFADNRPFELSTYEGIKHIDTIYSCNKCKVFVAPQKDKNMKDDKIYYKKIISSNNFKIHLDIFKGNL